MLKKISTLIVIIICSLTLSLNIIGCGETQNSALKDITGITFTDVEYDYDGTEKTITILGNLPNGITAAYSNNKGTNAGKYNASVTLKGNGYKDLTLNATLTINKISYDMSSVKWNYTKSFVYDGKEKSVTVSNLPNGVTVKKYTDNTKTQVGNYTASVEFNYDNVNYLQPTISPCNWSIIENQGGGNENQGGNVDPGDAAAVILFDDKTNRTEYSTSKQVWEQNGITVTNNKAASTSNVGDYANPGRFYKSSDLTIEYTSEITKIIINTPGGKYIFADNVEIAGATLVIEGNNMIFTLDTPSKTFTISGLANQIRASQISVYTE